MQEPRLLLVQREDSDALPTLEVPLFHFSYAFEDCEANDGLRARPAGSTLDSLSVLVSRDCEPLEGGYRQHGLNRLFAQALMRQRPIGVVVVGIDGCSADLPRLASIFEVPVVLLLDEPPPDFSSLSPSTREWLGHCLRACTGVFALDKATIEAWRGEWRDHMELVSFDRLSVFLREFVSAGAMQTTYDYALYEFCQRDHPLLVGMQQHDVRHFEGCSNVLDLACGAGIFLDCLRQAGIPGRGVELDERIAEYARGMGLDVQTGDALAYLDSNTGEFDGIYCSHFIEHLAVEDVQRLLELFARTLAPGGVLVLAFPDPESIRSQLLGFWRDPEHVRFYHPELVTGMAAAAGFELDWSSYDDQPHPVVPFHDEPPAIPAPAVTPEVATGAQSPADGFFSRLLQALGLATGSRMRQLEDQLQQLSVQLQQQALHQQAVTSALEARTAKLWDVNRTWAWNDNATLRLRKPAR